KQVRVRRRPRQFGPEQAVATAQRLFHARGYDAASFAELTDSRSVKPPSFYAAVASTGGVYRRALERYGTTLRVAFAKLLRPDRSVAESLAALLEEAACRYAADRETPGCLVLESLRCNDEEAREGARALHRATEDKLRDYIAKRHPKEAERLTDFVCAVMAGMS